jgi:hypothetical protein
VPFIFKTSHLSVLRKNLKDKNIKLILPVSYGCETYAEGRMKTGDVQEKNAEKNI